MSHALAHLCCGALRSLRRPLILLALLGAGTAAAADSSKKRHGAILARILSYELTLDARAGSRVGIAVVYKRGDPRSERNAADWMAAFSQLSGLKIQDKPFFAIKVASAPNELLSSIDKEGVDMLLVADGLEAEAEGLSALARSKQVLTASNDAAHVHRNFTVCVTEEQDKLKIVVNLTVAQSEKIRFSSQLLKLAKILR